MVPESTPRWPEARVRSELKSRLITADLRRVAILGVRGYYRDSMGKVGVNDLDLYDDALFVVSPNAVVAFNANTDPSVVRDNVATLHPGVYRYRLGIHGLSKPKAKQYEALVQADSVWVRRSGRDGLFSVPSTINIHRGSYTTTSSLGCQTIYPTQWAVFIALVKQEMTRYQQRDLAYVLIEGQG